jgi:hypothetical protein
MRQKTHAVLTQPYPGLERAVYELDHMTYEGVHSVQTGLSLNFIRIGLPLSGEKCYLNQKPIDRIINGAQGMDYPASV